MAAKRQRGLAEHLPVVTLTVVLFCAAAKVFPDISAQMIYSRSAIARGEIWRLLSCHFVHYNNAHLIYNLLAFGVAGVIIERKGYPGTLALLLVSAFSISAALFLFQPKIAVYAGLSGLACSYVVYLALFGLMASGPWRTLCLLVMILIFGKILMEFTSGGSLLPYWSEGSIKIVPLSHLIGALTAVFVFIAVIRKQKTPINTEKTGQAKV